MLMQQKLPNSVRIPRFSTTSSFDICICFSAIRWSRTIEKIYLNPFFFFFVFSESSQNKMIVDNVLQSYNSVVENVLPMLRKRTKTSYIGMAILCLVIKQIYSAYSVPKHLQRFPKVSFLAMIRSFLVKESVASRTKRLVTPLTDAGHGFYVVSCCSIYQCISRRGLIQVAFSSVKFH